MGSSADVPLAGSIEHTFYDCQGDGAGNQRAATRAHRITVLTGLCRLGRYYGFNPPIPRLTTQDSRIAIHHSPDMRELIRQAQFGPIWAHSSGEKCYRHDRQTEARPPRKPRAGGKPRINRARFLTDRPFLNIISSRLQRRLALRSGQERNISRPKRWAIFCRPWTRLPNLKISSRRLRLLKKCARRFPGKRRRAAQLPGLASVTSSLRPIRHSRPERTLWRSPRKGWRPNRRGIVPGIWRESHGRVVACPQFWRNAAYCRVPGLNASSPGWVQSENLAVPPSLLCRALAKEERTRPAPGFDRNGPARKLG